MDASPGAVGLDASGMLTRMLHVLDPETAHRLGVYAVSALGKLGGGGARRADPGVLRTMIAGLDLPNPVGLAAGFDKNAEAMGGAMALGFGFVEVGTVTPRPQPGNPKPRVFRLAEDAAVINRLGFNGAGMEAAARRLTQARPAGVVGVNLGANRDSDDKIADYAAVLQRLGGLADYATVNVSSPNTPGLRDLQHTDALTQLLDTLANTKERAGLSAKPLFLKVAPDMDAAGVDAVVEVITQRAAGVTAALIVSNTTIDRPAHLNSRHAAEAGGLSGQPLFHHSTQLLADFHAKLGPDFPLIGVGGVEDGATAYAKMKAGASAVQLYTALVYRGPGVVRRIKAELASALAADGYASAGDAVGAALRSSAG